MKKFLVSTAYTFVVFASGSALAADLPPAPPIYVPGYAPVEPPCIWCGFYIGINGGWIGAANDTINNTGTDTGSGGLGTALGLGLIPSSVNNGGNGNGYLIGGQVGFNWQAGAAVFGIEADFDGVSALNTTIVGPSSAAAFAAPVTTQYNQEINWLSTVRGRIGIAGSSTFFAYATGGLAVGEVKLGSQFICPTCAPPAITESTATNANTTTALGWTAGGGLEVMITPHWSVKAEYLYVDLGSHSSMLTYTYPTGVSTLTSSVHNTFNIGRAGVNYKF